MVTADVGCGKTTTLHRFTTKLDKDQYMVLYLSDSKLPPRWFYKELLAKETLEEIRFLLNYKMDPINPMGLILVGQNELWDKLKLRRYAAIRQRIDLKCEILQYDRSQSEEYI